MKYRLYDNFLGVNTKSKLIPYKGVVNNGTCILSQDYHLLEELKKNEPDRNQELIDWHLFRRGYSVLIDDDYNIFGCTFKTDDSVELCKVVLNNLSKTKDYKVLVDNLTVQQLAYTERGLQKYSDGEIVMNENRDKDGNINFENVIVLNKNGSESEFTVIIKWYEDFEDTGYMIDVVKNVCATEEQQ